MQINKAHCFFEQSGTFKNEFIKLGIPSEDYDIQNEFGQTDHICDLFAEIRGGYEGKPSVFDTIGQDDLIFAFFPCTRFETQISMSFRGEAYQMAKYSDIKKLECDLKLHKELSNNYELITKMAIICLKRGIRLIIENPLTQPHYLTMYWCLKPSILDRDRTERGDAQTKPTQYWFIGCQAENNIIFEPLDYVEHTRHLDTRNATKRSLIHPQYASRFIREFIL